MADGNNPYSDELLRELEKGEEEIGELLNFDTTFLRNADIPEIDENTPAGSSLEVILPDDTSFREPLFLEERQEQELREIQDLNRSLSTEFREALKNARNIEISKSKGKGKGKGKSKGKGKGRSKGKGKGRRLPQDTLPRIERRLNNSKGKGKGKTRRKKGGYKSKKKKKNTRKKK